MIDFIVSYLMIGIVIGFIYLVTARVIEDCVDWKTTILITIITILIWPVFIVFSVVDYAKDLDKRAIERKKYKKLYKSYTTLAKVNPVSSLLSFTNIISLDNEVSPDFFWDCEERCLMISWNYTNIVMYLYVHNTYIIIEEYQKNTKKSKYTPLIYTDNILNEIKEYNKKCRDA